MPVLQKQSAPLQNSESNFEKALSDIAHSYINDRAPKLSKYEIGFQLLDKEDDNTRAFGTLIYKIGKHWVLVPIFFIRGEIQGYDMMYIKNLDQFVPLEDDWINLIIGEDHERLGEPITRQLTTIGVRQPDYNTLAYLPYKYASIRRTPFSKLPALLQDIYNTINNLLWNTPEPFDLESYLIKRSEVYWPALEKLQKEYPDAVQMLRKWHPNLIEKVAESYKRETKIVNPILSLLDPIPLHLKRTITPTEKVSVISLDNVHNYTVDLLPKENKESLIKRGVTAVDKRNPNEVSKIVYRIDYKIEVHSPERTGIYDVVTKPGKLERCLVIQNIRPLGHSGMPLALVIPIKGDKLPVLIDIDRVKTPSQSSITEFREFFDKLPKLNSFQVHRSYVLINRNGSGFGPFTVIGEYPGDERPEKSSEVYEVVAHLLPANDLGRTFYYWPFPSRHVDEGKKPRLVSAMTRLLPSENEPVSGRSNSAHRILVLSKHPGEKILIRPDVVIVPSGFKAIPIRIPKKLLDVYMAVGDIPVDELISENWVIRPGNWKDLHYFMADHTRTLTIRKYGPYLAINGKQFSNEKEAFAHLIKEHNLTEKEAWQILDESKDENETSWLIKLAMTNAPANLVTGGPNAPLPPDMNLFGIDPITAGRYPVQNKVWATETAPTTPDHGRLRSLAEPDPRAIQMAMQAAQRGDKEIFDTGMLLSLLRMSRHREDLVERDLPDLMRALNRLGKLRFMFYWHKDRFAERYGGDQLQELDESLRNTFEQLGHLIIILKRKGINRVTTMYGDQTLDNLVNLSTV